MYNINWHFSCLWLTRWRNAIPFTFHIYFCFCTDRKWGMHKKRTKKQRERKLLDFQCLKINARSASIHTYSFSVSLSKYSLHISLWFTACATNAGHQVTVKTKIFPQRRRSKWSWRIEWVHKIYMFILLSVERAPEKKIRHSHHTYMQHAFQTTGWSSHEHSRPFAQR